MINIFIFATTMIYKFRKLAKESNFLENFAENRICRFSGQNQARTNPDTNPEQTNNRFGDDLNVNQILDLLNSEAPNTLASRATQTKTLLNRKNIDSKVFIDMLVEAGIGTLRFFQPNNSTQFANTPDDLQLVRATIELQRQLGFADNENSTEAIGILTDKNLTTLNNRLRRNAARNTVNQARNEATTLNATVASTVNSPQVATPEAPVAPAEIVRARETAQTAVDNRRDESLTNFNNRLTKARVTEIRNNLRTANTLSTPNWFNNLSSDTFDRVITQREFSNSSRIIQNLQVLNLGALDIPRGNNLTMDNLMSRVRIPLNRQIPTPASEPAQFQVVPTQLTYLELIEELNSLLNSDNPEAINPITQLPYLNQFSTENLAMLQTVFNATVALKQDLANLELADPIDINYDHVQGGSLSPNMQEIVYRRTNNLEIVREHRRFDGIAAMYIDLFGPINPRSENTRLVPGLSDPRTIEEERNLVINGFPSEEDLELFCTLLKEFPQLTEHFRSIRVNLSATIQRFNSHPDYPAFVARKYQLQAERDPSQAALEYLFPTSRNGAVLERGIFRQDQITIGQDQLESMQPAVRTRVQELTTEISRLQLALRTSTGNARTELEVNLYNARQELQTLTSQSTSYRVVDLASRRREWNNLEDQSTLSDATGMMFSDPAMQSYLVNQSTSVDATGATILDPELLQQNLLSLASLGARKIMLDPSADSNLRQLVQSEGFSLNFDITDQDKPITPDFAALIRIGYRFRSLEEQISLQLAEDTEQIQQNPTGNRLLEQFRSQGLTTEQAVPLVREGLSLALSYSYSAETGHQAAGSVAAYTNYLFEWESENGWQVRVDVGSANLDTAASTIASPEIGFGIAVNRNFNSGTEFQASARAGSQGLTASVRVGQQITENINIGVTIGSSLSWKGMFGVPFGVDLSLGSINRAVARNISSLDIFNSLTETDYRNIIVAAGLDTESFDATNFGRVMLSIRNNQYDRATLFAIAKAIPMINQAYSLETANRFDEEDYKVTQLIELANQATNQAIRDLRTFQGGVRLRVGTDLTNRDWFPIGIRFNVAGQTSAYISADSIRSQISGDLDQNLIRQIAEATADRIVRGEQEGLQLQGTPIKLTVDKYTIILNPDGSRQVITEGEIQQFEAINTAHNVVQVLNSPDNLANTGLFFREPTQETLQRGIDAVFTISDLASPNGNIRNQIFNLYSDPASGIILSIIDPATGLLGVDFGPSGNLPPRGFNITRSQVFTANGSPQGQTTILFSNRPVSQQEAISNPATRNPIVATQNSYTLNTTDRLSAADRASFLDTVTPYISSQELSYIRLSQEDSDAGRTLNETITREALASLDQKQIDTATAILANQEFRNEVRTILTTRPSSDDIINYDPAQLAEIITRYLTAANTAPSPELIYYISGRLNESLTVLADRSERRRIESVNNTIEGLCNNLVTSMLLRAPYNQKTNTDGSITTFNQEEILQIRQVLIDNSKVTDLESPLAQAILNVTTEEVSFDQDTVLLSTAGISALQDSIGFRHIFAHSGGQSNNHRIVQGSRRNFDLSQSNTAEVLAANFLRNIVDPPITISDANNATAEQLRDFFASETVLKFMAINFVDDYNNTSSIISAIYGAEGALLFNSIITSAEVFPLSPSQAQMLNHFINFMSQIRNSGTTLSSVDIYRYNPDTGTSSNQLLSVLTTTQSAGTVLIMECANLTFYYNMGFTADRNRQTVSTEVATARALGQTRNSASAQATIHTIQADAAYRTSTEPTKDPGDTPEEDPEKDVTDTVDEAPTESGQEQGSESMLQQEPTPPTRPKPTRPNYRNRFRRQ